MRMIDADALIEIFEDRLEKLCTRYGNYSGEAGVCAGAIHLVREQPTIEPEQRWIPCSERLPEEWSNILVTNGRTVMEAYYLNGKFGGTSVYRGNNEIQMLEVMDVTAWMPLPSPYEVSQA